MKHRFSLRGYFSKGLVNFALNAGGKKELHGFVRKIIDKHKSNELRGKIIFIGRSVTPLKPLFDHFCESEKINLQSQVLDFPRAFFDYNDEKILIKYIKEAIPDASEVTLIDDGQREKFLPRLRNLFQKAGFKVRVYALGFNAPGKKIPNYLDDEQRFRINFARLALSSSGHPYRIESKLKDGKPVKITTSLHDQNLREFLEKKLKE